MPMITDESRILPIHFFTLVLNGEPFIRHHITQFEQLPFQWHWHIIEGVAKHKFDTAWSLANGASIPDELHSNGLSNDGTTAYIDSLKTRYPDHITIYRKPEGAFWEGKLEMVNAPLGSIKEDCLLWQVDADELWTSAQLSCARKMFIDHPEKRAAFFRCYFFVGPSKVVSTYDTYGNQTASEWIRLWRFHPGDQWISHEPPTLCGAVQSRILLPIIKFCEQFVSRKGFRVIRYFPKVLRRLLQVYPKDKCSFSQDSTYANNLIFIHYAYVIPTQVRFKEIYYGYKDCITKWELLQANTDSEVYLRDFFPWVKDEAIVKLCAEYDLLGYK